MGDLKEKNPATFLGLLGLIMCLLYELGNFL
jgi:hypothetical protein